MTRRRWIADEVAGDRAALVGEHATHLVRVLRARIGQEFDIATGNSVRRGQISSVKDGRVEFDLTGEVSEEASAEITLILAVFKFDRMEWAIEKCTELGVSRVVPLIARRTDSHLAAASMKRVERWQRIAHQASEQSRRSSTPEINAPVKLPEILIFSAPLRIVLSELEERTFLRDVVKPNPINHGMALAVGPEGGWTEDELNSFQQAGWVSASLGNTILRAETAAVAAVTVASTMLL